MAKHAGAREKLRAQTARDHERVDALFSRFDLSDREQYGRFLTAQSAAHIAAESALDAAGAEAVLPDWPSRRRTPRLLSDLAALDLQPATASEGDVRFDGLAAVLGGVYVLEGSRLGGALLRRSVPAEFPASFLEASDPSAWRRLLLTLDEHLRSPEALDAAAQAAAKVFALFKASARQQLETRSCPTP